MYMILQIHPYKLPCISVYTHVYVLKSIFVLHVIEASSLKLGYCYHFKLAT